VRVLSGDERSDAGAFAPIERPRLVARLAASASFPITLLIAPAGYGKSVVLRQYLREVREPYVRFALRGEHTMLLSFLRGLAESLGDCAPHAITSLAGAYERTTASPKRAGELAAWMHAHLEAFRGVVAIDDLHVADGDTEVGAFLASLIERTKARIRWILASRSTTGLPLGTWLAYRDADMPVGEEALRFTLDEVRSAAAGLGLATRDEELSDLLTLTEGWPAAMTFALQTSTRSTDLRNVSAITREMIYRFLAEQVYSGLNEEERALLEVAIALPIIDVSVLERAGFDRALPTVERLRERTAFIYEESRGIYQCHELFREFLRHQSALGGKRAQQLVHERAARALESSAGLEHAIEAYVLAASREDVVRLLELHGFDMLERARGDVVARAIESLDDATRRENATILALQGTLQAIAGRFARAESLLRRSLTRAGKNRDLFAITSLRLASLLGNQGSDISSVLEPVASDNDQTAAYRAEALSLIVARQALAGDTGCAGNVIAQIEALLPEVESDVTRAKVLHHLGIASRHIGKVGRAVDALTQSGDIAAELHLYGIASRANAVLSNLALHEEDDVDRQLKYAETARDAATRAGDAFALQTALLQILSARMRRGDIDGSIAVEERLSTTRTDDSAKRYLALFRSVRLAWEGHFGEAHRVIASCWARMHFDFDRVCCGAQYALFLALDDRREASMGVIREIFTIMPSVRVSGLFGARSIAMSKTLCALAEFANGRASQASRILRGVSAEDVVAKQAVGVARSIMGVGAVYNMTDHKAVADRIQTLMTLGYGDMARLLEVVHKKVRYREERTAGRGLLTTSEREVLRLLAGGLVPKEIAAETTRSVNTVRVHIANAIEKLECHGRSEAIIAARQLGLI
jgi:ATP/maltotriose-dependent transcriptional regulator MalT